MVYGMGFATNSHTIPTLMGPGSLIISDSLNHTSIVEGSRASSAKAGFVPRCCGGSLAAQVTTFKHNDPSDLERVLYNARVNGHPKTKAPYTKILVIVEGVYSMEGEMCRLPEVRQLQSSISY